MVDVGDSGGVVQERRYLVVPEAGASLGWPETLPAAPIGLWEGFAPLSNISTTFEIPRQLPSRSGTHLLLWSDGAGLLELETLSDSGRISLLKKSAASLEETLGPVMTSGAGLI